MQREGRIRNLSGLPAVTRNDECCRALAAPAALLLTVGQGTCRGLGDTRTVLGIALGMPVAKRSQAKCCIQYVSVPCSYPQHGRSR